MYTQELTFQRRADLTLQKRFLIAYIVLFQNSRGCISRLARKNNVSRQTIYKIVKTFSPFCADYFKSGNRVAKTVDKTASLRFLLLLRMSGKCSIPAISEIMAQQHLPNRSVGYISQKLTEVGKKIDHKLNTSDKEGFTFYICSDEIFAKQVPILITVDAESLLILKIELSDNRKAEVWRNHWQSIQSQGVQFRALINDEGTAMKSAKQSELADIDRQSDTFHAVAHRLGGYVRRLLVSAYKSIGEEYECARLLDNSRTETTQNKRRQKYETAKTNAQKAIALYDNFVFLYHCLLACFQVFDEQGNLKGIQKIQSDFDTALEYIKELNHKKINEEMKNIVQSKADLFTFYQSAENILTPLAQTIDSEVLRHLCLAWQCHKNTIKAKNGARKQKYRRKEQYLLDEAKALSGNQYQVTQNTVYEQLNHIIQSSAAVECINSLLRPYLNNSKNQVTQEFLNLFMFYHNNRCFKFGERKGKSPMQIATDTEHQTHWIDLILQKTGVK